MQIKIKNKFFNSTKRVRGLVVFFFVLFLVLIINGSDQANAAVCGYHDIYGWAWSSNIGWISLSCRNTGSATQNYGLDVDFVNHTIAGFAWSDNVGWICFGLACTGTPQIDLPLRANYDEDTGAVSGWAKILSLGDDGWLRLRGGSAPNDYGITKNPDGTLSGFAWNGWDIPGLGIGWVRFSPPGAAVECNDTIDNDGDGEIDYPADSCCYSANDTSEDNLCLSGPWVQALYRDLYIKGNISSGSMPPGGRFNASYLIMADGTIANWRSGGFMEQPSTASADWTKQSVPGGEILFPEDVSGGDVIYSNAVGQIDYTGLITDVGANINKYGNKIKTNFQPLESSGALNNDVYFEDGDLDFPSDSDEKFFVNNSGPGIIVVNGDLILTATTSYDTTDLSSFSISKLGVVVWIVRGDLHISPDAGKIVGNFIVLGDGTPATCPSDLSDDSNGCGRVYTGTRGGTTEDDLLVIEGLVIARQFKFERIFSDETGNPAEQIIFDGRLFANPPTAMRDLLRAIPLWQEVGP